MGLPGERGPQVRTEVLQLGADLERGVETDVVTTVGLEVQKARWRGVGSEWLQRVQKVAEGGGDGEAVEMGAHAGGGPEQ